MLPTQKEIMLTVAAEILRWAIGIGCALLGWMWLSEGLDMIVR